MMRLKICSAKVCTSGQSSIRVLTTSFSIPSLSFHLFLLFPLLFLLAVGCAPSQPAADVSAPSLSTASGQQSDETDAALAPVAGIHTAILQDDLETLRQHILAGSDLNQKDQYGSSPLILAATFGKTEAAKQLIEAGAGLQVSDTFGSSPLHIASLFGREEIVQLLLDAGADRFARNKYGASAYDIVATPFEDDKPFYDQISASLAPLGFGLDYQGLRLARQQITELLRPSQQTLSQVTYTPATRADWPVSTPEEQGLDTMHLAELYLDAAELETLFGLLVVRNGSLVAEGYFNAGAMDKPVLLQSVTKSYYSALVGLALEQGCLSGLDQTMAELLPGDFSQLSDPRKQQITVEQLLKMRGGYPWEETKPSLWSGLLSGNLLPLVDKYPLVTDPGAGFNYSNLSTHILGLVVSQACNTDLSLFAEKHLFAKLGIKTSEWWQDQYGFYYPFFHMTARDVARFGQMYLDQGRYQSKPILPEHWVEASLQNYSEDAWIGLDRLNKAGRYFRELGYGYQWWSARVGEHRFDYAWGHGGQLIILLNDLDMMIVTTGYPFFQEHNERSWRHERGILNIVGKYIQGLNQ